MQQLITGITDFKLISICTAAYNAEKFIETMLDSILSSKHLDEIELIIVNDGSKDNTQSLVQEYVDKYPDVIRLINKENGGSGSARNIAFKMATGKYIKLIDADDYVVTENFDVFLDKVKDLDADLIINPHYQRSVTHQGSVATKNNLNEVNLYKTNYNEGIFSIDNIPQAEYFSMHDVTYRTSIIRDNHIQLSEGKSYVDMEYLTLPIQYVHSYAYIPEPFYVYQIGIPGQSIDAKVQLKKQNQKRDIISRIKGFIESTELSAGQRLVVNNSFERILKSLVNDYRGVCSLKYRKAIKENDQYVKSLSENAYNDLGKDKVIRAFRATDYFAYYPYMMIKCLYRVVKAIIRACTAKKVAGC